ncbi:MAG: hypothetical protein FWG98_12090 [Candidatus Cloacimonetes bacterium]|nr:hypothetical protein [Candidatus Cloacimonadota bacterium]
MKTKTLLSIMLTIISLVLIGCAGRNIPIETAQPQPEGILLQNPSWYDDLYFDDLRSFSSYYESIDREYAERMADQEALTLLTQYLNGQAESLRGSANLMVSNNPRIEVHRQTAFESSIDVFSSASIRGAVITRRETYELPSGLFRAYVQRAFDEDNFYERIEQESSENDNPFSETANQFLQRARETRRQYKLQHQVP